MNLDTAKAALYTWVKRETDIEVIFARQGAPRPPLPYATILFVNSATRVGSIDETRISEGDFKQRAQRTALVSLNIFGAGANDLMSKLRDSLDRADVIEEFAATGLAHIGENGPNDLTALEDTKYIERSQLDLTVLYAVERDTDTGVIETVEITGQVGSLSVNETITVEE